MKSEFLVGVDDVRPNQFNEDKVVEWTLAIVQGRLEDLPKKMQELGKSIERDGIRNPIIVNDELVVRVGHQRLAWARGLGYRKIAAVVGTREEIGGIMHDYQPILWSEDDQTYDWRELQATQ